MYFCSSNACVIVVFVLVSACLRYNAGGFLNFIVSSVSPEYRHHSVLSILIPLKLFLPLSSSKLCFIAFRAFEFFINFIYTYSLHAQCLPQHIVDITVIVVVIVSLHNCSICCRMRNFMSGDSDMNASLPVVHPTRISSSLVCCCFYYCYY